MRAALIIASALALAACATVAPGTTSAAVRYHCADGKAFVAAWNQPGDRVRVSAGGTTRTLSHARSASGARYASGGVEIWGKGDEATLSGFPGGPYSHCRAD